MLGFVSLSLNTQAKHKQDVSSVLLNQDDDCSSCCNHEEKTYAPLKKSAIAEKTFFEKITDSWCSIKCWFINMFDKDDSCDANQTKASKESSAIKTTDEEEDAENENIPHKSK